MPSPFPGMDPYLEGSLWVTVHTQLCAEMARQLVPRLRPKYLALTTERFVMTTPESVAIAIAGAYPDVGVTRVGHGPPLARGAPLGGEAPLGREVSVATAPLRLATVIPELVPQVSLEIRDAARRQLVTAIELLSSANKVGEGREEYLAKRGRILRSSAHLIEIDLLREGARVPMMGPLPEAPYFVFLSRADARPMAEVWPIPLAEPLPTVPCPLLPGDPDVPLDLQQAFSSVYDLCGYDLAVSYSEPPEVPLPGANAAWAAERLRGFRPRT